MKYSDLIQFNPIEDVVQLTNANDADNARRYVQTYVMSDQMANNLKTLVIDQLQMDEVIDNHGVLIVGNYGTGKSHLMSVISAVANNADYLSDLQNKKFAADMKRIAGKFEVVRFEFTGTTLSFRETILEVILDDFAERGIAYTLPDLERVKDNKKLVQDIMLAFNEKYPGKGYLLVVDELLNYLSGRTQIELVRDLEFLRVLGEMCSKSKLRVIFGMQEKLFDNPHFAFVKDTLGHVRDRITEMVIAKEDTSYVVSERILKKTPEQKALIRDHLEKFSELYSGMSNRMDDFVNMFPIHPAYIDILNRVYLIENRHVLKNISTTIKDIFNQKVPEEAPGIISFDQYWPEIKKTPMLRTDPEVKRVLDASEKLEDIIEHAFPKKAYKPVAIKMIYALSVHRLTTRGLDVPFGMTAENMKDDLCLYLSMPVQDAEFLLGVINVTLKDIMTTVSGQFITHNSDNNQYYIDVDKTVDYDEKVKQRAELLSPDELNRNFYKIVFGCLEWTVSQYVTNFEIYQRDIQWDSHNIYREGYLFMGLPNERSTAQPERDFYIHIMPPYGELGEQVHNLEDEVYFYFKAKEDFTEQLKFFTAANVLAQQSEGKDKSTYEMKAAGVQKALRQYVVQNINTCFEIGYKGKKQQLIETLKGKYNPDRDFKDTIDLATSLCLENYFANKYPEMPVFKTKVTRANMNTVTREAYDYFSGRKTKLGTDMVASFGLLKGDKLEPEQSKYAAHYLKLLQALPAQGVINYDDLFESIGDDEYEDKRFHISNVFAPILFLSLVYKGYATMTLGNNTVLSASNLETVPKVNTIDLREFKYLAKPSAIDMQTINKLFEVLYLNPALLLNPADREEGMKQLLQAAQKYSNLAVNEMNKLNTAFTLWAEPMVNSTVKDHLEQACKRICDEFTNYPQKYNTYAKLNNFNHTLEEVEKIGEDLEQLKLIQEYLDFKEGCAEIVTYITGLEFMNLDKALRQQVEEAKEEFHKLRDEIRTGANGKVNAQRLNTVLEKIRDEYINVYFAEHNKKRLGIKDAQKRGKLQESKVFSNLKKLSKISVLTGHKLEAIENDLAELKVCYNLTPTELKEVSICQHCGYHLGDGSQNVSGVLENLEDRMDNLLLEWQQTLLDTISDTLVMDQKRFLKPDQQKVIDDFVASKQLPETVDVNFVQCITALMQGFEPVEIKTEDIIAKLEAMGPCDVTTFKSKVEAIVESYIKGKDQSKLRIMIKK